MTLEQFRAKVETFLRKSGEKPSTFGRRALSDPSWVKRLRGGLEPKESTRTKVLDAIRGIK